MLPLTTTITMRGIVAVLVLAGASAVSVNRVPLYNQALNVLERKGVSSGGTVQYLGTFTEGIDACESACLDTGVDSADRCNYYIYFPKDQGEWRMGATLPRRPSTLDYFLLLLPVRRRSAHTPRHKLPPPPAVSQRLDPSKLHILYTPTTIPRLDAVRVAVLLGHEPGLEPQLRRDRHHRYGTVAVPGNQTTFIGKLKTKF